MKKVIKLLARKFGYQIRHSEFKSEPSMKAFGLEAWRLGRASDGPSATFPFIRDIDCGPCRFKLWITNPDTNLWYPSSGWQGKAESTALQQLVTKGDRVLEFGSHHGFTGLMLGGLVGATGRVVGVEANPVNAMVAQSSAHLNEEYGHVRFLHAAGSDSPGQVRLSYSHNASVTTAVADGTFPVSCVVGDDLDKAYGPFDALKVDVEGFEYQVLRGCKNILSRRPKLALELHYGALHCYGRTAEEIFELIDIEAYKGTMYARPGNALRPFRVLRQEELPPDGILNVFLEPK